MIIRNSTCCNVCEISLLSPVSLSYTPSPLERTSKKGNANKSQINWKAKKKIYASINPEKEGRGLLFDFFFGDSFVFLLEGLQSQTAGSLPPTSTDSKLCGGSAWKSLWPVVLLPQQSQAHADAGETSCSLENQNRRKLGQREWVTSEISLCSHVLNMAGPVPMPNQEKVLERLG